MAGALDKAADHQGRRASSPRVRYGGGVNRTFRPGLSPYVLTLMGAAMLYTGFSLGTDPMFVASGLFFGLGGLYGLRWYRLDDSGIRRFGLCIPKHVRWDEIGGIRGRGWDTESAEHFVSTDVLDRDGNRLVRVAPWVRKRVELGRCIRDELRTRCDEGNRLSEQS